MNLNKFCLILFIFSNVNIITKDIPLKEEVVKSDAVKSPVDKTKKTKGYFGKSTSFYDKYGKAKLLNKDFKSLTIDELEHNRAIHQQNKDNETVVRYTERMIAICKDPVKIGKLRLELADLCFEIQRYDRAAAFYVEFTKMYPGSKDFEHALHRTILSKYSMSLPADKDQTQTIEAAKAAKEYLANSAYTKKRKEVEDILKKCNKKLLDYELNNFNFYLNKGNIKACQQRLKYIKDNYFKDEDADQSLITEMQNQIDAKIENRKYKPKYEITTNTNLLADLGFVKKQNEEDNQNLNQSKTIDYAAKF